jgi:hypothetical protein
MREVPETLINGCNITMQSSPRPFRMGDFAEGMRQIKEPDPSPQYGIYIAK